MFAVDSWVFLMSPRSGKMVGTAIVLLCVVAFSVGIALLWTASTMPAHVDETRAQELTDIYDWGHFNISPQEREERENEIVSLRTAKWPLYNIGLCICLVAATLAVPIVRFRLWDMRNLKIATTPQTRWRLITLASAAWLALIPATFMELHDEYAQDDLMPHSGAPAVGIFWATGVPAIVVIWAFATLVCRFVVLRNANLPAALWCADYRRSYRRVSLNGFYGTMIGLLVVFVAGSAVYYIWAVPSGMVGIYVMLSSRAGLLSRKISACGS
jgi:hypothetical protein